MRRSSKRFRQVQAVGEEAAPTTVSTQRDEEQCPGCGSSGSIISVDEGVVCEECGMMIDSQPLHVEVEFKVDGHQTGVHVGASGTNHGSILQRNNPRSLRYSTFSRVNTLRSKCAKAVNSLIGALRLSSSHKDEAMGLLVRATGGRFASGRISQLLVAVCVYIVCRRTNKPISLLDVAEAAQLPHRDLGSVLSGVRKKLGINLPLLSPEAFIERLFSHYEESVFEKDAQQATKARNACLVLLDVCRDMRLLEGRVPATLAAACTYLSLNAHVLSRGREPLVSEEDLSSSLRVAPSSITARRREICNGLARLVQCIAWGKGITRGNIRKHLPSILENISLLRDLYRIELAANNTDEATAPLSDSSHLISDKSSDSPTCLPSSPDPEEEGDQLEPDDSERATAITASVSLLPTSVPDAISLVRMKHVDVAPNVPLFLPPSFTHQTTQKKRKALEIEQAIGRIRSKYIKTSSTVGEKDLESKRPSPSDSNIDPLIERLLERGAPPELLLSGHIQTEDDLDIYMERMEHANTPLNLLLPPSSPPSSSSSSSLRLPSAAPHDTSKSSLTARSSSDNRFFGDSVHGDVESDVDSDSDSHDDDDDDDLDQYIRSPAEVKHFEWAYGQIKHKHTSASSQDSVNT